MKNGLLYVHGKNGSGGEAARFIPLFPDREVTGPDFHFDTPQSSVTEIYSSVKKLSARFDDLILIANSIGAYFSMVSGVEPFLKKAFFISPVVDLEKLILNRMRDENVSEEELRSKGVVPSSSGEDFSIDYLRFVRDHPIRWSLPTEILYGSRDGLTDLEAISSFAKKHNARLTVMEGGEHWFHTEEQMSFLDAWLRSSV